MSVPAALGYRMPAEWEPHAATWLAWPHNRTDWPGKFPPIPWVYAEMVRNLAAVETVHLIVQNAAEEKQARRIFAKTGAAMERVQFHRWRTDRVWTRDYGPIFVRNDAGVAAINFRFNAWAKYPDWKADNQIPARVAKLLKVPLFEAEMGGRPFVLEGGSIDVNGCSTLMTTEECLLSEVQARNPGASRGQIEKALHDYLGVSTVIWLERGIAGDDTHGHIDDIARFVSPNSVIAAVERKASDANSEPLAKNLKTLQRARDQAGRQLTVIELPMPHPVIFAGQRLPASYANFYIANGRVLVPVFNDPNDRVALDVLAEAMPEHEIVPIYCGDFIWGLGAIHCATQQQPDAMDSE
jgi:agmatine deiminase